ncbi:Ribosome biogenesis protein Slx9-like [Dillenia turbinata]|uniref:Ribosome biogenesis protein Slx9-like n=1 Tax=Dillenia turbinata TaxID=194707 RepID=A0AAN8UJ67_9MAGN
MGKTSIRSGLSKHADRKFEKKLQFYAKVRDTLSTLSATKAINKKKKLRTRQKKLKAYDFTSLSEFLPELKAPRQQTTEEANFKLKPKSQGKLIEKESRRLKMVLNHAAFQSDPLSTIHQHLQSTQPAVEEKPRNKSSKNAKKKKGKKKSEATPISESMEM